MLVEAEVIKHMSSDPYFKLVFSYKTESVSVERGYAEVVRKFPKPLITYDSVTGSRLGEMDISKLELELLNAVIGYLFANGTSRTAMGKIALDAV